LLSQPLEEEEQETVVNYLSDLAGRKVTVSVPERGDGRALCEMVSANAADKAKMYRLDAEKDNSVLLRLAELLCLETLPERIEAYDISNFGTEHLTAGMIVCKNGKFAKSDYRTFHIKSVEGTDDYASMREVLARRLKHLEDENGSFSEFPDLILLDGGRGHVATVRGLLREMELDLPVFGMVKDEFHKTRALCTENEEIAIAREQQVFRLIYRIQEEVHRYSVARMEQAKGKTLTTSSLEKIPGIGKQKAAKLLSAFGGLSGVKHATREQLEAVGGLSQKNIDSILSYFKE
jgi:excinuclease ABC subunit C